MLAFLEPWRAALRGVVIAVRRFYDDEVCPGPVQTLFQCWPVASQNDFQHVNTFHFVLALPTEGRYSERRHQFREALQLFNLLATIDGNAFVHFLKEFFDESEFMWTTNFKVVHPVWTCCLTGTISSPDAVATEASVTWGTLLGCPDDAHATSSPFQEALTKLKAIAREKAENWCDFHAIIEWTAKLKAITMSGRRNVEKGEHEELSNTLCANFRALFNDRVPPIAQLAVLNQINSLMEVWSRSPYNTATNAATGSAWVWDSQLAAAGIQDVAAALRRGDEKRLSLRFDENFDDIMQTCHTLVNAGYFISALVCGCSFGQLPNSRALTLNPCRGFYKLGIVCNDQMAASVYSALGEASIIDTLVFGRDPNDRRRYLDHDGTVQWNWLAYSFFSGASHTSVESLEVSRCRLNESDVMTIAAVMKARYPEQVNPSTSICGFVDLLAGTRLHFALLKDFREGTFVLSKNHRCRALYDPVTTFSSLNVVVPGYGICMVQFEGCLARFERDPSEGHLSHHETTRRGVNSLTITFAAIDRASSLINLLMEIGYHLRSLTLSYDGEEKITLSLDVISAACPNLNELHLTGLEARFPVDPDRSSLQEWGIKTLSLRGGCENVLEFANILRDARYRMSKQLVELSLVLPFDTSNSDADVLQDLDQDILPVVGEKFPIDSKVAIISVVRGGDNAPDNSAIHYLDERILSHVFTLAATPAARSVQVVVGKKNQRAMVIKRNGCVM